MFGSLAWSSAAWAAVNETDTKDVPATEQGKAIPTGDLNITDAKTGKEIGHGTIQHGTAHIVYDKNVPPDTPVNVKIHNKQTGKTTEIKDKVFGVLLTGGIDVAPGGSVNTSGSANATAFGATPVPGKIHLSFTVGASSITSLPTTSSSGFFSGNTNNAFGTLIGGSIFDDFMTFGSAPGPFGTFVLSGGVVVDTTDSFLQEQGTCGGEMCDNSIRVLEVNYIGELKLTTPLSPGNTINGYIGAGAAHFSPSGMPTGPGGPAFVGTATTWAYRVGWGIDHQFDQNWSAGVKVGFQWTGPTTYNTTLPGEHFHFGYKDEYITAVVLTYTPSIDISSTQRNFLP